MDAARTAHTPCSYESIPLGDRPRAPLPRSRSLPCTGRAPRREGIRCPFAPYLRHPPVTPMGLPKVLAHGPPAVEADPGPEPEKAHASVSRCASRHRQNHDSTGWLYGTGVKGFWSIARICFVGRPCARSCQTSAMACEGISMATPTLFAHPLHSARYAQAHRLR